MSEDNDDCDVFIHNGLIVLSVTDYYGHAECNLTAEEARNTAQALIEAAGRLEKEPK